MSFTDTDLVSTAFCVLPQLLQFKLCNVEVKLQWVPAHIRIHGNEEADKLANTAHLNGIECPVSPCYSEVLREPSENKWSPSPIVIDSPREITKALPTFWERLGYLIDGNRVGGGDRGGVDHQTSHALYKM
ncbi:hypothetical protein EVAR_79390_1 [Eumeta japonica]|uniref:RNase H type-1 domain-containing protein n=1 Tax=Eumeta variegata TaxID=151549 RepID=A0A4C1VGM4_EUMVA|nr:hypothetical protein EVAR_79390_1 [Eumeta japonica]